MAKAHFENIAGVLLQALQQARRSIDIAVCWFTHRDLFDALLERLDQGVSVNLVLEYDTQNIRENGLDFQRFVALGGKLWGAKAAGLLHHKFVIIDKKTLLTGSFNWTYNSNAENLLLLEEPELLASFRQAFDALCATHQRVYVVRSADAKPFAAFPLFERTLHSIPELRKQVSGGAAVWVLRLDWWHKNLGFDFSTQQVPFDKDGLLADYWRAYRVWDEGLLDHHLKILAGRCSPVQLRDLRRWTTRMQVGDLLLAVRGKCELVAVGVVQGEPQAANSQAHSTLRQVQWPYRFENKPLQVVIPAGRGLSKYKGSTLRLLDQVNPAS
jgi:hypothetical protein